MDEAKTVSVEQAARILGISTPGYYKQAQAGRVPGLRIGRRIVVPRDQLEAFLAGSWQPRSAS